MDERTEIEAIQQLKYRYLRFLDLKDWDGMRHVFTPEACAAYSGGKYSFDGRDAILEFLVGALGRHSMITTHHVHHPEITLEAEDRATGTWALEDMVIDTQHEITIRGSAYYSDVYVKREGAWLIERTGYERIYEEMESRKERPGLRLTANRFASPDDPAAS